MQRASCAGAGGAQDAAGAAAGGDAALRIAGSGRATAGSCRDGSFGGAASSHCSPCQSGFRPANPSSRPCHQATVSSPSCQQRKTGCRRARRGKIDESGVGILRRRPLGRARSELGGRFANLLCRLRRPLGSRPPPPPSRRARRAMPAPRGSARHPRAARRARAWAAQHVGSMRRRAAPARAMIPDRVLPSRCTCAHNARQRPRRDAVCTSRAMRSRCASWTSGQRTAPRRSASSSGAASRSGRSPPVTVLAVRVGAQPRALPAGTPSACTSSAASSTSGPAGTATGTCESPRTATRGPRAHPAFFPLYPLLVGGVGRFLAGHYLLAGVLVSLAASRGAFVLLYRLALPRLGADGARRAVLYLALFPTALFLGAVYSESLFLLLALATFAARGARVVSAGPALQPGSRLLTRPAGLALLPRSRSSPGSSPQRARALVRTRPRPGDLPPLPARALALDRPAARLPRRAGDRLAPNRLAARPARRALGGGE